MHHAIREKCFGSGGSENCSLIVLARWVFSDMSSVGCRDDLEPRPHGPAIHLLGCPGRVCRNGDLDGRAFFILAVTVVGDLSCGLRQW